MKVHVKYAKGLLLVVSGLLAASIVLFLTGHSGLILIALAIAVVGYMIFAIGKSGLPGSESVQEQAQKEHEENVQNQIKHDQRPDHERVEHERATSN